MVVKVVVTRGVGLRVRDGVAGVGVGVRVKVPERVRRTVPLRVGALPVPLWDRVERVRVGLPVSLGLRERAVRVSLTVHMDERVAEGIDGVGVKDGDAVAFGLGERLGDRV